MKQTDVKKGESYLFGRTDVEHRKFMQGTIVTVSGIKCGSKRIVSTERGLETKKNPKRFKLTNGHWANAANLNPIPLTPHP